MIRALSIVAFVLAMLPAAASAAPAQPACEFKLGFKALHDQIAEMVGSCLENERHNSRNGNTEQRTTAHHGQGGLLVWRKADNWTAFTDGGWTWIAGPNGIEKRPNSGPLFDWEAPAQAQESAAPVVEASAAPPTAASSRPAPSTAKWAHHDDPEKSFDFPAGWQPMTRGGANVYLSPDGQALLSYGAPYKMGQGAKLADFLGRSVSALAANNRYELGPHESLTTHGYPAELQSYAIKGDVPLVVLVMAVQRGAYVHVFSVAGTLEGWEQHEDELARAMASYVPKTQ